MERKGHGRDRREAFYVLLGHEKTVSYCEWDGKACEACVWECEMI